MVSKTDHAAPAHLASISCFAFLRVLRVENRQRFEEKCENQNAHEVSRDLTAWALSGIGPILAGKSAPGLGPPRSIQSRESGDCLSVQTVDRDVVLPRPLTQQGGWADSRLDGRGISLKSADLSIRRLVYPDPFLGSGAFCRPLPVGSSVLGPTQR
jgi:hypothetical protein